MKNLLIISLILFSIICSGQAPNDCANAVIVCSDTNLELNSNGIGIDDFAIPGNNPPDCSFTESQSLWLKIIIEQAGTLAFTIIPESNNVDEDYDFAVYGPNVDCNNLGSSIRCSSTNPVSSSSSTLTGLNDSETDTSEGPGPNGNGFVRFIDVLAGEEYYLLVDNFSQNGGFTIDFTGTARFPELPTNETPSNVSLDIQECDSTGDRDDGITEFNLEQNTNFILGNQVNTSISYHRNINDANAGVNSLSSPYTSNSANEIIFARISNDNSGCFDIVEFSLTTFSPPILPEFLDFELCDVNNDNTENFVLNTLDNDLLNGLDQNNNIISYHPTPNDAINNTAILPNNFLSGTNSIVARVENIDTGCFSTAPINLILNPIPISNNAIIIQCDDDGLIGGLTFFNLNEANNELTGGLADRTTQFYLSQVNAENDIEEISNIFETDNLQTIIYVRVIDDITGCFSISELTLEVSLTNATDATLSNCDDDGIEDGFYTFTLSDANNDVTSGLPNGLTVTYYETSDNAFLELDPLPDNYTNTTPFNQTIFVRVENNNACFGINQLELIVNELPNIETEAESIYCLNFFPETITLSSGILEGNPEGFTYLWSTGETASEIQVNEIGIFTVTVTNGNMCSKLRTINVTPSNIATFENISVTDVSENNTITITVSGEGNYEYALDDINGPYQNENVFENVAPGIHTVYVRDINNCGIVEDLVSIIGFPRFFTPNQDGTNDTWQVFGLNEQFQPNTIIFIFDRYGKLLKELNPLGDGWDGTFNGESLPTNDYWFQVTLQDGRLFTSHFTLKR